MALPEPAAARRPSATPLTVDDLGGLPDDGRRHELVDGVLVVTPCPVPGHQWAVVQLSRVLADAAPAELAVFGVPLDVVVSPITVLEPDVSVIRMEDVTRARLVGLPLLVVEILSPSTRRYDLMMKRSAYEEAGIASYWMVDPDPPGELVVYELEAGRYRETARVTGDAAFEARRPFRVTVVPAQLILPED